MAKFTQELDDVTLQGISVGELLLSPQETKLLPMGITTEITDAQVHNIPSLLVGDDDIYAYGDGSFVDIANSTARVKTIVLSTFKKTSFFPLKDYLPTLGRLFAERNIDLDTIDGSDVEDIELQVFAKGLLNGMVRNFWLGDTEKVHTANGNYAWGAAYTTGSADLRLNHTNGIWKKIALSQSLTGVEKVPYSTIANTDFTTTDGLKADVAMKYFDVLMEQSFEEFKDIADSRKAFYVTRAMKENYKNSLKALNTEFGSKVLFEGVETLAYQGIPILDMPIQQDITKYGISGGRHRAILTLPENLVMVMGYGDYSQVKLYNDNDKDSRKFRAAFQVGFDFIHSNLMSAIAGSYVAPE